MRTSEGRRLTQVTRELLADQGAPTARQQLLAQLAAFAFVRARLLAPRVMASKGRGRFADDSWLAYANAAKRFVAALQLEQVAGTDDADAQEVEKLDFGRLSNEELGMWLQLNAKARRREDPPPAGAA